MSCYYLLKIVEWVCCWVSLLVSTEVNIRQQHRALHMPESILWIQPPFTEDGSATSGVARALPGGRAAHPEDQNDEENEEHLKKMRETTGKLGNRGNVLSCPPESERLATTLGATVLLYHVLWWRWHEDTLLKIVTVITENITAKQNLQTFYELGLYFKLWQYEMSQSLHHISMQSYTFTFQNVTYRMIFFQTFYQCVLFINTDQEDHY